MPPSFIATVQSEFCIFSALISMFRTFYSNIDVVNHSSSHVAVHNTSPRIVPYPRERPERPGEVLYHFNDLSEMKIFVDSVGILRRC